MRIGKKPVVCHKCSYQWKTRSILGFITCPNCGSKIRNKWRKEVRKKDIISRHYVNGNDPISMMKEEGYV